MSMEACGAIISALKKRQERKGKNRERKKISASMEARSAIIPARGRWGRGG
jgi:hypothetical protein